MSQYALSVTLATFLRARPPPTKIRVTLSIKTFARGSSFPHSRFRLARPPLQKTWREKKIRVQRNNELHEKRTRPGGRKLQFSELPTQAYLPFSPLSPRSHYEHFSFVHFMIFLSLSYRDLKVQASRSPDTVILYTQRHDASGRKENDNLEPRAVIVRELNFDSQQLFAISRRNVENCITDPRRGKSSITWRYGDDRSTHLVMLHDGSGLSLGGHIQSRRVCLSFPRGAATVFPSLFRPVPIPQLSPVSLVLLAYRFSLLVGVTLLAPPKARIISRNKSEVRCSFIRFTSFSRSPQLSLSLVQPRNDNTNCTYTYTLYKERENVLYERDVVNTSRRHVLLTNFLRVLGFSSASFRHSHTVSF